MKAKKSLLIASGAGLVLVAASCAVFFFADSYPWEYLIEKEVRLQRVEMRIGVRLDRLIGCTRDDVSARNGRPENTRTLELPATPFWGPQEELVSILTPGQPYEEWRYSKGAFTYLIWFAGVRGDPDARGWKVVATGMHREGVVY